MGAVERLFLGFALVTAFSAVGCAAGEEDEVAGSTQTATARSTTPRKVFAGSTARPTYATAIDEWTTEDGSRLPTPLPIEDELPAPPQPREQ